jgi:hypothetical protein
MTSIAEEMGAFEKFTEWKNSQNAEIGETYEDWEPWWNCFLAGYKAAQED